MERAWVVVDDLVVDLEPFDPLSPRCALEACGRDHSDDLDPALGRRHHVESPTPATCGRGGG